MQSNRTTFDFLQPPPPIARWEWIAVAVATIVGFVLRAWNVAELPPGLWYDEAINGLDALSILREPGWPVFFTTEGHPREPMIMYLDAIAILIGGTSALSLRAVNTVAGTLTIPAVWWMARQLAGPRVALFTLLFFVPFRWHVHFSRLAFRTNLTPLFGSLITVFLVRSLRERRSRDALIAGILCGLSLYTYLSMRLFMVALVIALLVAAWWHVTDWRDRGSWRCVGLAAGFAAMVFLPLAIDYVKHPDHFSGREDEISLMAQGAKGWKQIAVQARDVALMGILRGDHVGKHNIPGRPVFSQAYLWDSDGEETEAEWTDAAAAGSAPNVHGTGLPVYDVLTGLLFYAGIANLLYRIFRRQWPALWVVLVLVLGSLASILSDGAPNMLRLMLLVPFFAFTTATAANLIYERLSIGGKAQLAAGLIAAWALWFAVGEMKRYFVDWARHPALYNEFNVNMSDAARSLVRRENRPATIIVPDYIRTMPTFSYQADGIDGIVGDDPERPITAAGRAWVIVPQAPYPPVRFAIPSAPAPTIIDQWDSPGDFTWAYLVEINLSAK